MSAEASAATARIDRPLRVGIVGCGGIARSHAQAYANHPQVELVGLMDIRPERARAFAETYDSTAVDSVAALLALAPDLVSVATPPGSHADVAVELLEGGTSVLVEKPPTPTLAELDRIAAAEAASRGNAYVVFQHRHGSGALRAHELLTSGALGRPQVAVCETLWFRPDSYFDPDWRGNWAGEGGGPTLGHGIHQIDLLLHLMGEWETVDARAARIARPVEFEDVSMALVGFAGQDGASGAVASVVISLLSPRELSRIRIDTTGGTLEVNHVYGYADADWSWSAAPGAAVAAGLGRDPGRRGTDASGSDGGDGGDDQLAAGDDQRAAGGDPWQASAGTDRPSNHAAQIERLVDDLLAGRRHDTTLASTRPTMEFVTALYASAVRGRTVRRGEIGPGDGFYSRLDGGLPGATITERLRPAS